MVRCSSKERLSSSREECEEECSSFPSLGLVMASLINYDVDRAGRQEKSANTEKSPKNVVLKQGEN
jgi:hypothetical protein